MAHYAASPILTEQSRIPLTAENAATRQVSAPPARPGPMSEDDAAWIRANIWTGSMRKTFREVPGAALNCSCQYTGGPCSGSQPRHDTCHVGIPLPGPETYICAKRGGVTGFREPYQHASVSATGWRRVTTAMVWLADRVCRWACSCDCGHPGPAPAHAVPPPPPAAIAAPELERVEQAGRPGEPMTLPGLEHLGQPRPHRAEAVTIAHFGARRRGRGDRRRSPSAPANGEALVTLGEIEQLIVWPEPRVPVRIQRRRTKGWRKPDGAIIVDRTSRWGNPWRIEVDPSTGLARVFTVRNGVEIVKGFNISSRRDAHQCAVTSHRIDLLSDPDLMAQVRVELAGRDLVCPCQPDEPCHADNLLRVANDPPGTTYRHCRFD